MIRPRVERHCGARGGHTKNLAARPGPSDRRLEPENEAAFAHHQSGSLAVERRQPARECPVRRHDLEAIVRLEDGLVDRVDATGNHRRGPALAQKINGGHNRRKTRRLFVTERHVRTTQLEVQRREARGGVADSAVEQKRGRPGRPAAKQRLEEQLSRLSTGRRRTQHHANRVIASVANRPRASASAIFVAAIA